MLRSTPTRCLLTWLAASSPLAACPAVLGPSLTGPAGADFDALLVRACAWALVVAAAWLSACTALVAVRGLRGSGQRPRALPGGLHRLLLRACGVVVVGAVSLTPLAAHATPGSVHHDSPTSRAATTGPAGPAGPAAPASGGMRVETAQHLALARPPAGTARPHEVLVAPGDSLWSISEQALPGATTGEVADHVSRLHAANRAVVGTDPDLIHPGQRLALPDATD